MWHLFVTEPKRTNKYTVPLGTYGKFKVMTAEPTIVGYLSTTTPRNDFKFSIPCMVGGVQKGVFNVDLTSVPAIKFATMEYTLSTDATISIILEIAVSAPLKFALEEPVPITFPHVFSIGHRGSGSNKVSTDYLENSIPGFHAAKAAGAEFVEFDIQLDDSNVPVIFHDFYLSRAEEYPDLKPISKKKTGEPQWAIKQFDLKRFKATGLETKWHVERPQYSQLLGELPIDLAFDVELKYPSESKFVGKVPYLERNSFLDIVLEEMKQESGQRPLFFSSFDIYLIMMLALKQKRWPVFQLFCKDKEDTVETMATKIRSLIPLYKEIGVKGFVIDSEQLLKVPDLVGDLIREGFIVNTYGSPNNTKEGIMQQLRLGISGICTDKLSVLKPTIAEFIGSK